FSELRKMGLAVESDQALSYVLYNMTIAYARQMKSLTGATDGHDVLKMLKLEIDANQVQQLSKAMGRSLQAEEGIAAANHELTPQYTEALRRLLPGAEFDEIDHLQKHSISVEFVQTAVKCHPQVSAGEIDRLKKRFGSPCASLD